jgi:hypothetical protein
MDKALQGVMNTNRGMLDQFQYLYTFQLSVMPKKRKTYLTSWRNTINNVENDYIHVYYDEATQKKTIDAEIEMVLKDNDIVIGVAAAELTQIMFHRKKFTITIHILSNDKRLNEFKIGNKIRDAVNQQVHIMRLQQPKNKKEF